MKRTIYFLVFIIFILSGCRSLQDIEISGKYYNTTFYNVNNTSGILKVYSFYEDHRYEGYIYYFENKKCTFRDSTSGRWDKISKNKILLLSDIYLESDHLGKMVAQIVVGNSDYSFNNIDTLYIKDKNTIACTDKYINPYIKGIIW